MTYAREPILQPVTIESLRPTQITVGMREVEEKRKRLRKHKPEKIGAYIGLHMEGLRHVLVTVVLDLSALKPDAFWSVLDHKNMVYPFDPSGRRRDFANI